MSADSATAELALLQEEYCRLTAEIRSRYDHYYHFHYLIFVTAGALSAVYFGFEDQELRSAVFLLIPLVLIPIMLLMLKEHAYMDLREAFIQRVLIPRAQDLLRQHKVDDETEWRVFSWSSWEETSVRTSRRSSWVYGLLGAAEFLIPLLLSFWALFAYRLSKSDWTTADTAILGIELSALCLTIAFTLFSRLTRPHLPILGDAAADKDG